MRVRSDLSKPIVPASETPATTRPTGLSSKSSFEGQPVRNALSIPHISLPKPSLDLLPGPVKDWLNNLLGSVDLGKNIDALAPGDDYGVGLGPKVSGSGFEAFAKGDLNIERDGSGYTLKLGGELGGGVLGQIGASLGIGGTGSATLAGGGDIQMRFSNPADAKRGLEALLKVAATQTLEGIGVPSDVARSLVGLGGGDEQFVTDHFSAIDLHGDAAANISGQLGSANLGPLTAGLFGGANVGTDAAVQLDFAHGKPNGIELTNTFSGGVDGSAGVALASLGALKASADGKVSASISVNQHFDIPQGVSLGSLVSNPVGTIGSIASQLQKSDVATISTRLDAWGSAPMVGGELEGDFVLRGKPEDVLSSLALQEALAGNFQQAASDASGFDSYARVSTVNHTGISGDPGFSIMGFGADLEFHAERNNRQTVWSSGSPLAVA